MTLWIVSGVLVVMLLILGSMYLRALKEITGLSTLLTSVLLDEQTRDIHTRAVRLVVTNGPSREDQLALSVHDLLRKSATGNIGQNITISRQALRAAREIAR